MPLHQRLLRVSVPGEHSAGVSVAGVGSRAHEDQPLEFPETVMVRKVKILCELVGTRAKGDKYRFELQFLKWDFF